MVCFVSLGIFLACLMFVLLYSIDIYQISIGGFLGMILFIFVKNIVFSVIPHFRHFCGNSAMRKIWVINHILFV